MFDLILCAYVVIELTLQRWLLNFKSTMCVIDNKRVFCDRRFNYLYFLKESLVS